MFHWYSEVSASLKRNKLRTTLTGFSVGWGVLLLVVLLGIGTGFSNGINANIEAMGMKAGGCTLYVSQTKLPYAGYERGRSIVFYDSDLQLLLRKFPEIKGVYPSISKWYSNISFGGESLSMSNGMSKRTTGVFPEYAQYIKQIRILEGRFISFVDIKNEAKNIVIDQSAAERLFGKGVSALGKIIEVGPFSYTVVGVYKTTGREDNFFVPFTTMASYYPGEGSQYTNIDLYCPDIVTEKAFKDLTRRVRHTFALVKEFSPDDNWAIWMNNDQLSSSSMMTKLFVGLNMFLWFIGLSILCIGIVGVSNIMLVSVQERLREFGIRKALGAQPKHIIGMVLTESIFVTLISGLIGLILSVALLFGADYLLTTTGMGIREIADIKLVFFQNPVIPVWVAAATILVMVLSGALAGYMPARKAIRIPAIEAMRDNK